MLRPMAGRSGASPPMLTASRGIQIGVPDGQLRPSSGENALGCGQGLLQPLGDARQSCLVDHLLVGLHPGDVRVAEQGDALGPEREDLVGGRLDRLDRLVRQAVEHVDVR